MANGDHPPACPAYYIPMDIPKYDRPVCECQRPITATGEPKTVYDVTQTEIEILLAAATLYIESVEGELETDSKNRRFQEIMGVLHRHGKRY